VVVSCIKPLWHLTDAVSPTFISIHNHRIYSFFDSLNNNRSERVLAMPKPLFSRGDASFAYLYLGNDDGAKCIYETIELDGIDYKEIN
jgi:hypothetical protein